MTSCSKAPPAASATAGLALSGGGAVAFQAFQGSNTRDESPEPSQSVRMIALDDLNWNRQ